MNISVTAGEVKAFREKHCVGSIEAIKTIRRMKLMECINQAKTVDDIKKILFAM